MRPGKQIMNIISFFPESQKTFFKENEETRDCVYKYTSNFTKIGKQFPLSFNNNNEKVYTKKVSLSSTTL